MSGKKRGRPKGSKNREPKRARKTTTTVVNTEKKLRHDSEVFKWEKKGQKSEQTVRNRAEMSRARCLNDDMDPGIMPCDPPSAMTYGRRKRVAPVLKRDELRRENPEELERLDDASPEEARHLAKRYKAAGGMRNVADHLLPPDRMVTTQRTSANTEATASAPGYSYSSQALSVTESLAKALGTVTTRQLKVSKYMDQQRDLKRQKQQKKKEEKKRRTENGETDAQQTKGTSVRGRAIFDVPEKYSDDPALFGGRPEGNEELAIMESRGQRQMTRQEIEAIKPLHAKKTKHKPKNPPDRYIYSTDAPPGENDSVFEHFYKATIFAPERLENEADEIAENGPAVAQPSRGGFDDDSEGIESDVEAAPQMAIETRNISVVDPESLEPKGLTENETRATQMAKRYERPSALPYKDLSELTYAERKQEQGLIADASALDSRADDAEFSGLPHYECSDDELRQPLLKYFQDNHNEKVTDDPVRSMAQQFVFDNQSDLGNLEKVAQIWQQDTNDSSIPKLLPTGAKQVTKTRKLVMRDIKKKHEVGVQDFNPPRRSVSFSHAKASYCLRMLSERDIFFADDRPKSMKGVPTWNDVRGVESKEEADNVVMPDRTQAMRRDGRNLLTESEFGLVHSMAARILEDKLKKLPTPRVGTNHFLSSYQLGTMRIHPLDSPDLPKVDFDYHRKFMTMPDPRDRFQRPCINNEDCLCYTTRTIGTHINARNNMSFVAREFLLPDELEKMQVHSELPKKRRMCIICYMSKVKVETLMLQYRGSTPTSNINNHCVVVDQEGGYKREDMLPCITRRNNVDITTGIAGFFPDYNSLNFERSVREITYKGKTYNFYYMDYVASRMGFR